VQYHKYIQVLVEMTMGQDVNCRLTAHQNTR